MRLLQSRKKLDCLLKSLPQNYSHIGVLVDVLPEKERTVDYLKSKIKLKSIEGKSNEASNDSSNVFQTETRSVSQKIVLTVESLFIYKGIVPEAEVMVILDTDHEGITPTNNQEIFITSNMEIVFTQLLPTT